MNSQPRVIEQPALTRDEMFEGLKKAYAIVIMKVLWEFENREHGYLTCVRVLNYLGRELNKHWATGTAFEWK